MLFGDDISAKAIILRITGSAVHDGPGIRTVVALKGCPLLCEWCSTPESQKKEPELAFYPGKCTGCLKCVTLCPENAIGFSGQIVSIDREHCSNCGRCARVCDPQALVILGTEMTSDEVVAEVMKDAVFFRLSGGGAVISGGEPLLNVDFTTQLARLLKEQGVNTGIDTCGHVPWANIEKVLPYAEFFLWDVKLMDREEHKRLTGVYNDLILSNLRRVSQAGSKVYLRCPVIPGLTDSEDNLQAIRDLAKELMSLSSPSRVKLHLLPAHHLGMARYAALGRPYPIDENRYVEDEAINRMKAAAEAIGIDCGIEG